MVESTTDSIPYNDVKRSFPFDFVGPILRSNLSPILDKLENEDEPYTNFDTAINTILVWAGARTCSLPQNYYEQTRHENLIDLLNAISRQVPNFLEPIPEIVVLRREQI
jgi:hypothetical protein